MIIYGSKATQLAKETGMEGCPSCGTLNSMDLYLFQKHAHVFWIPLFPIGKTGASQCTHCKQVLKRKEMPAAMQLQYDNLKAQSKTPLWTFAGSAVIAVLIVIGIINEAKNDARNARLVVAPQRGDVFNIKTKERQYTLYKVAEVAGDSALIRINHFETNQQSGLEDIKAKGDSAYSNEVYPFSKGELKVMLDNGEILDIERD
jgi:hypothetical protein